MARPTQLDIMGTTFRIVQVKKIDKDDSMGECEPLQRTIKIKAGLNDEMFESTLLHEVIHAILTITGQAEYLKHEQEEAIVLALEHGLGPLYGRFH